MARLSSVVLHGVKHQVTESDLIPVEFGISTDNIREALLFAVAHGWRPPVVPPAADSFDESEAPTARMRSHVPAAQVSR